MFDLEQSIAQWRQQMLAAGISALALDELESHLMEEIERRMKSGLSEAEAFKAGVHEIGLGETLTREFNKVEANDITETAIDSMMQIIGWIAAGCILLSGYGRLEMDWNLWGFEPKWDLYAFRGICEILVAEVGIWILVKVNRHGTSRFVSLLICLFLGWVAVLNYHHQMYPRGILGGLREPNPFWYRWSTTLLLLMPGVFWISRRWLARRKKQLPIAPTTIVAERIFSASAAFYIIFISVSYFRTGDGARYTCAPPAALLAILLTICGCLASSRVGNLRRAMRWV